MTDEKRDAWEIKRDKRRRTKDIIGTLFLLTAIGSYAGYFLGAMSYFHACAIGTWALIMLFLIFIEED